MSGSKDRLRYIDIAKAIGIVLVIIGHIVPSNTTCKRLIYAFHMPLFFFVSGLLLYGKTIATAADVSQVVIKRAKRLLIPYFIWGMIYSTPTYKNAAFVLYGSRETLLKANSLTSLWFFPVMFLAVILAQCIISALVNYTGKKSLAHWFVFLTALIIAALSFLLPHPDKYGVPWGGDVALMAAVFCLLGYLLRPTVEKIKPVWLLIILGLSLALLLQFFPLSITDQFGFVLMAEACWGRPAVFMINAVSGIVFTVCVSRLIAFLPIPKGFMQSIGKSTMGILLVHKPIIDFMNLVFEKMGQDVNSMWIISINTIVTLLLSLVLVLIIEKIIPEILGSERKPTVKAQSI